MQIKKFIIVAGASRAGSTSLFNYLTDHPEVSGSFEKETNYFLPEWYPVEKKNFLKSGVKNYDSLWDTTTRVGVDATPDYMYAEEAAIKIHKELQKNALIVFILRNPVERFCSYFNHAKQRGFIRDQTSIEDYYSMQLDSDSINCRVEQMALDQGNYSKFLPFWLDRFDRSQIKIVTFTHLKFKPKQVLKSLCDWCEIDNSYYNDYEFRTFNESQQSNYPMLNKHVNEFIDSCRRVLPDWPLLKLLLRQIRRFVFSIIYRPIPRNTSGLKIKAIEDLLNAEYIGERSQLSRLVGPEIEVLGDLDEELSLKTSTTVL